MFVTLIIYADQHDLSRNTPMIVLSLGGLSLILLTILASLVSFYATRPSNLAELMIAGRRGNEALASLAAENLLLLKRSTAFVRELDLLTKKVRSAVAAKISIETKPLLVRTCEARELLATHRSHIEKCKAFISAMKHGQFRYTRLAEELVFSASKELNIRPETLSGSLLHFSPTIFRERTEEIDEKFSEMIDGLSLFATTWGNAGVGDAEVIDGLAETIEQIVNEGNNRARHQETILENHRLNATLLEVVASRSSSLASQRYARCLAQAMRLNEAGDRRSWRRTNYSRIRAKLIRQHRIVRMLLEETSGHKRLDEKIRAERRAERLRYIHAMQQAYPGIWPHLMLSSLFRKIVASRRDAASHSYVPDKCHFLTVKRHSQILLFGPKLYGDKLASIVANWRHEVRKACAEHEDPGHYRASWSQVSLIEAMPRYVTIHAKNAKRQIATRFERFLQQWLHRQNGNCFLVTQGNSSTVKAAFKRVYNAMQDQRRLKDKIYTVCFPSKGDPYFLEPRRIIHSLKFPEMQPSHHRTQSAILRLETFSQLLNNGDSVLFVVGTEGIDADWRFVHPLGLSALSEGLQEECVRRGARLYSVVLAEDHKLQSFTWRKLSASGAQVDENVEVLTPHESRPGRLITDKACYLKKSELAGPSSKT